MGNNKNASLIPMRENIEISKDYPPRQFFKAIILNGWILSKKIMRMFIGAILIYIIQNNFLTLTTDRAEFEAEIENLLEIVEVFADKTTE